MESSGRVSRTLGLLLVACALIVPGGFGAGLGSAEARKSILVELSGAPPVVVAADQARRAGKSFDRAAQERAVSGSQHAFLARLRKAGIDYRVTERSLTVAGVSRVKPNRFAHLINAVGLDVPAAAVEKIKALPGVRYVSPDEPLKPHLAESVPYLRASNGPGDKTVFSQGGGPLTRFDGAGQVIAIFDSGIDSTHPMFDVRFSDADYLMRTGDPSPVRTPGQPFTEGVHHPKVIYFFPFTATANQDDGGHGTACASHSAGVKVKGPGLDRIPGNADDVVVEGVAPGALLMNYKVCEGILTCVGTSLLVDALEDALSPTDPLGFPKPVATVINMSFGGAGDPDDASATAASNAALAGAVIVASAGNSGPGEHTLGSPSAGRRVISVAASLDPGETTNEVDVLVPSPLRYTVPVLGSTGAQNDTGRPVAPQDQFMKAVIMGGSPQVPYPLGQHYVYGGFADTPDQIPLEANGRIVLVARGSTVTAADQGTGLFANKAAEAAAKGAVAVLVFNNVEGELEAAGAYASAIPIFGMSQANGEYLRDTLGFASPAFDKDHPATWGALSNYPVRIDPPDPLTFEPGTTGFSSRGPVETFKFVKPDLTAPGQNIYGATVAAGGVRPTDQASMFDPSRFINASGTSFSGPHVAGSAALTREAMLAVRGQAPIADAALRSGSATAVQQAQNALVTPSLVRAALTNTATNLRDRDNLTPLPDGDSRNHIHEIGSGLVHVAAAADARVALGTNDANGPGGPDDPADPDFLPTHSFGQTLTIGTNVAAQTSSITVTLQNLTGSGAAGTYTLSLLDGGALRGDVTRPIAGTPGFTLALSAPSVTLPTAAGSQATFDVRVTVDGRPAPLGLAVAGIDVTGHAATEFLWWVVAHGSNGQTVRMPFFYRASSEALVTQAAPFQNAIQDDATPDQIGGVDQDGNYGLSWTFPAPPAEQPCGYQIEEAAAPLTSIFADDGTEPLLAGANSKWSGDPEWISSIHPDTLSAGYQVIYHDTQNVSLSMLAGVALPADTKAQLVFDTHQDLEDGFDYGFVEVSVDGSAYLPLARYTGLFSGQRILDLSAFAGKSIQIRFRVQSDLLISFPAYLGWFLDNIAIQTADWTVIGTTDASTLELAVTGRASGDYLYRITGLFGPNCSSPGHYSNIREIQVQRDGEPTLVEPTASFTASPNPAQPGQTVTFDASASADQDTAGCDPSTDSQHCIVSYFWSFGDSTTQTTTTPTTTHAYAVAGTYRVALTVTDNDDQTASTERIVEVADAPETLELKATGGGWIAASGKKAHFGFEAERTGSSAATGHLTYEDKAASLKVLSESITSLTVSGNRATFTGTCSVDKVPGFTFTVEVVDNGESGSSDTFRIRLSNGYERSGTLGGGNIQVHAVTIVQTQRDTQPRSSGR